MDQSDWEASLLRRHHKRQRERQYEWEDYLQQRKDNEELRQRNREEWEKRTKARKSFFEDCMKEIKSRGPSSNSLYDNEDHRDEIRQALEFIYDNARSAWSERHQKKAGDNFTGDIFKDMLLSNLSGKAGSIIDALESTESKALFLKNRAIMNGIRDSDAPEMEKRRAEKQFYKWRAAYIGDIIYHHAIDTVLDYLRIKGNVRRNIKYLLRTGALNEKPTTDARLAEMDFWDGHMVVPPRKYLLHNEDIVDAINHMNKMAEGKLLPRPLHRTATKLGGRKSVVHEGEDLTRFGLKLE